MDPSKNNMNNDDINLNEIIKLLRVEKKFIFFITSLSSIITLFYLLLVKPIWIGSFNIVINDSRKTPRVQDFSGLGSSSLIGLRKKEGSETQKLILKSSSVLMPVFESVREYYKDKNIKKQNFNFKTWLNAELDINYEKDTSILSVKYKNSDKELILKTLNLISEKYQNYSKESTLKEITKTINYLENQKEFMQKKALISMKKFNRFSIENGIGNIDGFIGLGQPTDSTSINAIEGSNVSNNINSTNNFQMLDKKDIEIAGIRFGNQFLALEKYETLYSELSSKLKKNSPTLLELQNKINALKNSLKRPNEILIEYKALGKDATRDEMLLANIENNLQIQKLELIKTPDAWEMISQPTINEIALFPKKKLGLTLATVSSFFISLILAIIKISFSGRIYNRREVDLNIETNYLETINPKFEDLSIAIVNKFINTSKEKTILINYKNNSDLEFITRNKFFEKNLISDFIANENLKKFDKFLIFIESGKVTYNDLKILNRYINLYQEKILGWIFIE